VIRGNVILNLLTIEKGFRDGDVRGPFSFAASVLLFRLPERLIEAVQIARYPCPERFTVRIRKLDCERLEARFSDDAN
jgi:hypothetical protein